MPEMKTLLAALALLALPVAAAPAAAQQMNEIEAPAGPWSPDGIDVSFPDRIGEYARVSVTAYGKANWAVGYNLWRGGTLVSSITVYFITARQTCRKELEGSMGAIEHASPDALKLSDDTADSPSGRHGAALHARYKYSVPFGGQTLPVLSDVYVYCRPGSAYWVKARSTWPESGDASGGVATVLRAIHWPAETVD
jgi:hypothetical protein